jgi:eukaryotic-like serine/threonine-protein kinase
MYRTTPELAIVSEDLATLRATLGDRYTIQRELGRGGMGAVYLARDATLDRPVALKVLPREFAAVPELRERFLRETRLAAGFSHPNIVPVFAIEDHDGLLAFAMGFVEGESLTARVARDGALRPGDAVKLLQDVAYALAYAHGRGVVHRDIKPDNIMIERATGRALVMDFGIARAITTAPDRPGLTRVGEVVGTPEYMSPEQASGDSVDGRSDLYSLGLVAWYALVGRAAVEGETTQRIIVRQLTEPVPKVTSLRPEIPVALADVVERCCEKDPDARYATAEALVEALDATNLAATDVPVAVRLLAPDLASVGMRAGLALLLLIYGGYLISRFGRGNVISLGIVIAATAWVSGLAAVQELRRLRRTGYTVVELQRLLGIVQAERDEARALRKNDAALAARRRKRVLAATALLALNVVQMYFLLERVVKNGDAAINGGSAVVRFFGGLLVIALTLSILVFSPFRRGLSEQFFSLVWLRPAGATLLRWLGGSGAGSREVPASVATPRAPVPAHRAAPHQAAAASPLPAAVQSAAESQSPVTLAPTAFDALAADVRALHDRLQRIEDRLA